MYSWHVLTQKKRRGGRKKIKREKSNSLMKCLKTKVNFLLLTFEIVKQYCFEAFPLLLIALLHSFFFGIFQLIVNSLRFRLHPHRLSYPTSHLLIQIIFRLEFLPLFHLEMKVIEKLNAKLLMKKLVFFFFWKFEF